MKPRLFLLSLFCLSFSPIPCLAETAYTDPKQTDADFPFQGEYVGKMSDESFGAQVVARGGGKFDVVICEGGLPGDGWNGKDRKRPQVSATLEGDKFSFRDEAWAGTIEKGKLTLHRQSDRSTTVLDKVERKSPTEGAAAPEGALVLFDGKNAAAFPGAKVTEDGLLMQGVTSAEKFQNYTLHLEFRLPYMPTARGQGRGNSGVYNQGRYEVQVLDSFGLTGENNECGGIYTIAVPKVNMCYPPLSWQTYDIDYTAAKFENGVKKENAKVTVKHNGVLIHENQELPHATTAAPVKEGPEPGPIYIQDHGNPVRYRNIWILKK